MMIMSTHAGGVNNNAWEFKLQGTASKFTNFTLRNQRLLTDYNFPYTFTINNWYHIAIVLRGPNLYGYVNGGLVSNTAPSYFLDNSKIYVGYNYTNYPYWWKGNLTSLRVTQSAVYTGNFTPSRAPLTVLPNTTFLMNVPGSNPYLEEVSNTSGTPHISPTYDTSRP